MLKFICHKNSGGEGSICAELRTLQATDLGWQFHWYGLMLTDPQRSSNAINNDECVAGSIMFDFWQGNFKESAYGFSTITAFTLLLLNMIY
mmetsp:Transcript_9722/g.11009  ORF Transcript_9722/g.11009 Transcript_9722/m.11009 type:complete len:91 (+) Transcript_9722:434-706(+)